MRSQVACNHFAPLMYLMYAAWRVLVAAILSYFVSLRRHMDRTVEIRGVGTSGITGLARPLHYSVGVLGVHLPKRRFAAMRR